MFVYISKVLSYYQSFVQAETEVYIKKLLQEHN